MARRMAGGGEAGRPKSSSDPLKRLVDQVMHLTERYHEITGKYTIEYGYRRLVRWWLEYDEWKVKNGGPTADLPEERPEERLLNTYVLLQAYVLMAVKGLGYLALTWSTVVLLGGFVTSLGREDFWCLTVISMIQAARIFDNLHGNLLPRLLKLAVRLFSTNERPSDPTTANSSERCFSLIGSVIREIWISLVQVIWTLLSFPANLVVGFVLFLYGSGPFVCMALSSWRLSTSNFGVTGREEGKANLTPALFIFYVLVLLQGAFYLFWKLCDNMDEEIIRSVCRRCELCSTWGHNVVAEYLSDTRVKCEQEPTSITDSNLVRFAVGLLDSELPDKYLSGARMLDELIKRREDVRSLLLLSRPKIQKLIDTLGWRSNTANNREIRELAARILADLASDIYLAQFPGAIQCISSLLEPNKAYCKKQQALDGVLSPHNNNLQAVSSREPITMVRFGIFQVVYKDGKKSSIQDKEGGGTCKELILHGLTILERLAYNQHNCRDICGTPGLIHKVMAPIYSRTLMEDIKITAFVDVVKGSLTVMHQLIRSPGMAGRMLRYDISFNKNSMSNLEGILIQGNEVDDELRMQAMEILTELVMDSSIIINRITEENLIINQVEIFLADEGENHGAILRTTAGRTLAVLTNKSEINCVFVTGKFNNIINRLAIMLDSNTNITYRGIAAEILENLCTHCEEPLHQRNVAEILLSKILTEMLCKSQRNISDLGNDEGGEHSILKILWSAYLSLVAGRILKRQSSNQGNNEEQTIPKELQEAFLSLTLVIYDRMISSADEFDAAVQAMAPGSGAFVAKLNTIIEGNQQATPDSLRIIKLCYEIAIAMIKRSQYTEHFKDKTFVESLSKASGNMSDLESCMLFAGTDFGVKKAARPLLYDLEKEFKALLQSVG